MKEHFVNKTDTPAAEKDLWQTPQDLFDALNKEFGFTADVCANRSNNLCFRYFSEEKSALENEWYDGAHFINPPYSQTELFIKRATEQAKKNNVDVVALVNANTDTKWFGEAVKSANEVRLLTGRVGFIKPSGKTASGNPKGQCLIIWRGNCKTPCQITMVDRDELLSKGKS